MPVFLLWSARSSIVCGVEVISFGSCDGVDIIEDAPLLHS